MPEHNWPVFGHDWAVNQLRKSIAYGRIRHAYLFVGTDSVGKHALVRAFTMVLNCTHEDENARPCGECRSCKLILSGNHPDVLYSELDPNTGVLKIEAIRTVTRGLAMKPFEGRYRVAIFSEFDRAQPRAQDALLKTLEEPPPSSLLLLLARSSEELLPTITSRSQTFHLTPVSLAETRSILIEKYNATPERADLLAHLSGGRLGWAINALSDDSLLEQRQAAFDMLEECLSRSRAGRFDMAEGLSKDKLGVAPLLELWQTYWRDLLLIIEQSRVEPANGDRIVSLQRHAIHYTSDDVVRALKATRKLIDDLNYNINLRLALEVMYLDYPGLRRENL